ncbi:hypothetical protein PC128_g2603 [Phytophthora cactorum]|nr:hypothetical protein PC128_g2603 [Phytophthora cactorum]
MQDHTHQLCDSLQKMFAGKDRVAVKQVRLRVSPRVHKRVRSKMTLPTSTCGDEDLLPPSTDDHSDKSTRKEFTWSSQRGRYWMKTKLLSDRTLTRALSDSVPACLVKRVRRRQTIALVMARDRASPVR